MNEHLPILDKLHTYIDLLRSRANCHVRYKYQEQCAAEEAVCDAYRMVVDELEELFPILKD